MSRCRLAAQQSLPTQPLTQLCHVPSREGISDLFIANRRKKNKSQHALAERHSLRSVIRLNGRMSSSAQQFAWKLVPSAFYCSLCVFHTELFHKKSQSVQDRGASPSPPPGNSNREQKQEFLFCQNRCSSLFFFKKKIRIWFLIKNLPFSIPAVHFSPSFCPFWTVCRALWLTSVVIPPESLYTRSAVLFLHRPQRIVPTHPWAASTFSRYSLHCNDKRTKSLEEWNYSIWSQNT